MKRLIKIDVFLSKVFLSRIKKVLPLLISSQQTVYLTNTCISESRRLISDFLGVTEKLKTKGYLVTIDIKKKLVLELASVIGLKPF